jgi:hypothetical protein
MRLFGKKLLVHKILLSRVKTQNIVLNFYCNSGSAYFWLVDWLVFCRAAVITFRVFSTVFRVILMRHATRSAIKRECSLISDSLGPNKNEATKKTRKELQAKSGMGERR